MTIRTAKVDKVKKYAYIDALRGLVAIVVYTLPKLADIDNQYKWFITSTLFFLHGFNPNTINTVVPGGWAVGVLMPFYAIFPFIASRLKTITTASLFLIGSLLMLPLSGYIYSQLFFYSENSDLLQDFIYYNFFSQIPLFAIGI